MAGKELSGSYTERPAYKFLFFSTLINTRFKDKLNCASVSYSTKQIIEIVKGQDYAINFKGFTEIGDNMVFTMKEQFDSNKNMNLIKATNDLNKKTPYKVRIVAQGYESISNLNKMLKDGNYTLFDAISLDVALPNLLEVHDYLKTI